jgi:hypothetical protein
MSIWRFHFAYEAAGFKAERGIKFPRELELRSGYLRSRVC